MSRVTERLQSNEQIPQQVLFEIGRASLEIEDNYGNLKRGRLPVGGCFCARR